MSDETNIQPIRSDFEQIRKIADDGREYWSARELATALGYSTWQKFNRILNKALPVAHHEPLNFFTVYRPEGENTIMPSTWHPSNLATGESCS